MINQDYPLIVDLDGTLIKSDLLIESFFKLIKTNPIYIFIAIYWAFKGKSYLKHMIAQKTDIDVEVLPYNFELINFIKSQKGMRRIILASASNKKFVKQIYMYLGIFDEYIASDNNLNLSKEIKAKKIYDLLGTNNYVYAGNSKDDLPIWKICKNAILVNTPKTISKNIAKYNINLILEYKSKKNSLITWLKCLRLHQWIKNTLIFVPLILSQQYIFVNSVIASLVAFLVFSICASSVYLLNDLLDIEDDRHHRSKKNRPIASGEISQISAFMLFPVLLLLSFSISLKLLPLSFNICLISYYALTLAYSLYLKKKVLFDVHVLAGLYTMRVVAGTAAIGAEYSFWLVTFSIFIFLSLAITKRYTELLVMKFSNVKINKGRDYELGDMALLSSLGVASGYISVVILALFINSNQLIQKYNSPEFLWFMIPVMLYWISRVWIIAHRGEMHDDPIVFAIKDKVSRYVGIIAGIIIMVAMWI